MGRRYILRMMPARVLRGAAKSCCLSVALAAAAADIEHSPFVPPGYRLEWNDEFDEPPDPTRWTVLHLQPRREWIVPSRRAVGHDAGELLLTAMEDNRELVTGWISTAGSYRRKFGYFEARIRLPAAHGLRAAFWLMSPTLGQAPDRADLSGAEIHICCASAADQKDRMISQGIYWNAYADTPYLSTNRDGAIRLLSNAPPQRYVGSMVDAGVFDGTNSVAQEHHVFGLTWTERHYVFSVDGRETFRSHRGLSRVPQFLCLAILPDPRQRTRPNRLALPVTMRVDYVRVYAPPEEPPDRASESDVSPAAPAPEGAAERPPPT